MRDQGAFKKRYQISCLSNLFILLKKRLIIVIKTGNLTKGACLCFILQLHTQFEDGRQVIMTKQYRNKGSPVVDVKNKQ